MTPSRRALSILGALALLSAPGAPHAFAASPAPAWERHLEGSEITRGWQLPSVTRRLADGSTLIVLSRQEGLTVVRYAADGAELSRAAIQPPFEVTRLAADPFGAVAAVGQNVRFDTRDRFWTMTWDGVTGRQLWKAPVVFRSTDEYASSYALTFAPDGDVLVAGAESSDEAARGITIRYARKDGAVRWGPVPFGSPDRRVSPSDIAVDPAGDIVVTGSDLPFSWVDGASGWTLAKFAGDSGAFLWGTEPLGVPFISMVCAGYCFSVYAAKAAFDAKGNVIFTVSSYKDRDQEWLTAKYDAATGAKVWGPVELNGAGTSWESPQELAVDAQGDVVITGLMGLPAEPWGDRVVVKYAGDTGTVRWGPVPLSASGLSHEASLALDGFGNVVLVGSTSIPNQSNPQDSVTEWNAVGLSGRTGLPVWQRRLSKPTRILGQSVPTQLTPSGHGTVTVTGKTSSTTPTRSRGHSLSGRRTETSSGDPPPSTGRSGRSPSPCRLSRTPTATWSRCGRTTTRWSTATAGSSPSAVARRVSSSGDRCPFHRRSCLIPSPPLSTLTTTSS